MPETFAQKITRNSEAYIHLVQIEVILREIIARELAKTHGHSWIKKTIPNDVRDKKKWLAATEVRILVKIDPSPTIILC